MKSEFFVGTEAIKFYGRKGHAKRAPIPNLFIIGRGSFRRIHGQQRPTFDAAEKKAAVAGIAHQLEEHYVLPAVGRKIAAALRDSAAHGEYEKIGDGADFADVLSQQLRQVGRDRHVHVRFSDEVLPPQPDRLSLPTAAEMEGSKIDLEAAAGFIRFAPVESDVLAGWRPPHQPL